MRTLCADLHGVCAFASDRSCRIALYRVQGIAVNNLFPVAYVLRINGTRSVFENRRDTCQTS